MGSRSSIRRTAGRPARGQGQQTCSHRQRRSKPRVTPAPSSGRLCVQLPDAPPAPCLPTPELSWGSPCHRDGRAEPGDPPVGPVGRPSLGAPGRAGHSSCLSGLVRAFGGRWLDTKCPSPTLSQPEWVWRVAGSHLPSLAPRTLWSCLPGQRGFQCWCSCRGGRSQAPSCPRLCPLPGRGLCGDPLCRDRGLSRLPCGTACPLVRPRAPPLPRG